MSERDDQDARRKWRRRALLAGIVVAIVCKSLPPDYRELCEAIAQVCTGALGP